MKVFLTGATGVLGRRTTDRLVAAGHEVTAVARSADKAATLRRQGARPVHVDLFDADAVRAAVAGHDAVVNLATSIPPTRRATSRRAWTMNDRLRTQAAKNLVDAALAGDATTVVQESITFSYADGGDRWLDEHAPLEPTAVTSTAHDAEAQAHRMASHGRRGVALRFGQFLAHDSHHMADMRPLVLRGWLPLVGPHDGFVSFVHADDAATAVVAALDAPSGIYNVAEEDPRRRRDHADALAEVLGRSLRLPPAWLGRLRSLRQLARSQRISSRQFREATGWTPHHGAVDAWESVLALPDREDLHAA